MTPRSTRDGPFAWQSKAARRRIRDAFDAAGSVASALSVYDALTEIASNEQSETFRAAHAYVAGLAGVSAPTVKRIFPVLREIGLIHVETPALRAPSVITLLAHHELALGNGDLALAHDEPALAHSRKRGEISTSEESSEESPEHLPGFAAAGKGRRSREPRKPDPVFDAIAEAFGYFGPDRAIAPTNAKLVSRTSREIRTVCPDLTAEEVRRRIANLRARFDNPSPAALVKWWADCANQPAPTGRLSFPQPQQAQLRDL